MRIETKEVTSNILFQCAMQQIKIWNFYFYILQKLQTGKIFWIEKFVIY